MQDRDRDGRISLKENAGAALILFNTVDADADGKITPDEMLKVASSDVVALQVSNTTAQTQVWWKRSFN